jgi:hypothetical protein
MALTTVKTGVTDTAAGAGVHEYLGLQGDLAALAQMVSCVPHGDFWQIKGSLSFTPTVITDTFPPAPVMAWKVPTGKALLFTGGVVHSLAATIEYYRVVRRYFLWGYQATAAPSAPAAPAVALTAMTAGIGTSGAYLYKTAPIDSFRRESAITVASASVTLTSTNQGVTVTPAALGTGAIGYNIYRTLAGGSTYYYVGTTMGVTPYVDAAPDAQLDTSQTPNATWTTGAITGEVSDGPCEAIIEVGGVAMTAPPTSLIYTGTYGGTSQMQAVTISNTIGARTRFKPFFEAQNFIPVGLLSANLWRGPHTTDTRTRNEEDYGVTAIKGVNAVPSAGCMIVWGQHVIGVGGRLSDPVAATIHAYPLVPTNPHGVLLPPLSEIVVEIGALAAGVAGVRDVTLCGLLLPTTGT